jgi:hypothetical protein
MYNMSTAIRYAQAATEQQSSSTGNAQEDANTRPSENSINSEFMENNATSNSENQALGRVVEGNMNQHAYHLTHGSFIKLL